MGVSTSELSSFSFPSALLSYFTMTAELSPVNLMPASDPCGRICSMTYARYHQVLPLKSWHVILEVSSMNSRHCLFMENMPLIWLKMTKEGSSETLPWNRRITCRALCWIKVLAIMRIRNSSIITGPAVINRGNIEPWSETQIQTKFKTKLFLKICFYLSVPIDFIKTSKTNPFFFFN